VLWALLAALAASQLPSEVQIPIKSVMQAIPQIDNTYSVVHTDIYPRSTDDRFKASVAPDFFVKKAL
jgi:hypothetical protein